MNGGGIKYMMIKDMIHEILTKDLNKRKVCTRFVPHALNEDQETVLESEFYRFLLAIYCQIASTRFW